MCTDKASCDRWQGRSGDSPRGRRQRKGRGVEAYTELGKRIAALGSGQEELAHVLGLSQQSISKKLRGEAEIAVSELELLSAHYRVPMVYFFETDDEDEEYLPRPELVAICERVKRTPGVHQEVVLLLDRLTPAQALELLGVARSIARKGSNLGRQLAAEGAELYGDA